MAKAKIKSTSIKDGLAKIIEEQRKAIDEGMDSVSYALEGLEGIKGGKPIDLHVEGLDMQREIKSPPLSIRVNISDVYSRLTWDALCSAKAASSSAIESITKGHIEKSLKNCIRAERFIGASLAFNKVWDVKREIAKGKAGYRHKKTLRVREQAIKLYHDKVSPKLSVQKAVDELFGLVLWENGNEVAHRTLVEWIAAEKKKASSSK